jgi:type IV secretory pathway VirB3-like protein
MARTGLQVLGFKKMPNFLGTTRPSSLLGVQIPRNVAKIGSRTAFAEHVAVFFWSREPVSMMKVAQKERPS